MKKMNGLQKLLALVLALILVLGSVCAAMAEDPQPTDLTGETLQQIKVYPVDGSSTQFFYKPSGDSEKSGWSVSGAFETDDIKEDEPDDNNNVLIYSNDGKASLSTGDIVSKDKEYGAVMILTIGQTGKDDITFSSGTIDAVSAGLAINTGSEYYNPAGGKVNATTKDITSGVEAVHIENNTATIEVTADNLTVSGAENVIGVSVDQKSDNPVTTTINADSVSTTTTGEGKTATGVVVEDSKVIIGQDEGATGDVKAKAAGNATGIKATLNSDVTALGDVEATGAGDVTGISADSSAVSANSVSATTTGDNKNAIGLNIKDGTVIIGTDENTDGTDAGAGTTGTDEKKDTNGDVMAKTESGLAMSIVASGNSDVTVYGDVSVEAGIVAEAVVVDGSKGESRAMVEGSITAKCDGDSYGVGISSEEGSAMVCVQNGISVSGGTATGIDTRPFTGGDSSVFVQGDVKAESKKGYAAGVSILSLGGKTTVNIDGNVTGDGIKNGTPSGYGIDARYIDSDSSAQVEINGTLSGTAAAIWVNKDIPEAVDTKSADISVWAAKENDDGKIAVTYLNTSNDETKALEDSIHYIIRIADTFKGMLTNDAVTPEKSKKTVTFGEGEDQKVYKTANMDEKVTIDASKITLSENEVLEGVYYYYDKPENENAVTSEVITENTNGIYTLTMGMSTLLDNVRGMMQLGLKTHTHNYSVFVRHEKEPTCTETGVDVYKCEGCDATITETVAVKSDNHSLADGAAKAVTCTEDGWDAYKYCTKCSYTTKDVITAKGHTEVADAAVAATCTKTGLTAGKHCSACSAVLVAQTVVPATGHTPGEAVPENEIPPKNGVSGSYDEVVYCKVCKEELSRKTVIVPPPKDDAKGNPNAGEDDVTEFKPVIQNEKNLSDIPMSMDVSSDDDDVKLDKLANCPDALKERAKEELSALKRSGYKIDCGCGAWSKSGNTAACTLKLSEKGVPDGAQIFVNGAAVQAERKDGYYYVDITLPAVVLVAHK